jgi:gas vesicle protein
MMENNKNDQNSTSGLTYLLIGGGIGAVLALLFAPKTGAELRGEIADVSRRGYDATLEKAADLKVKSSDAIHIFKDKAEAAYEFASSKLATGKEAVTDAMSSATDAVNDGIERLTNEAEVAVKQAGNGRKPSNIV